MGKMNRWGLVWVAIAVVVSVYLRADHYLANPSLYIDEANVARNVAERPVTGFWKKLDYQQYAPPVFMALTQLSCEVFGYHEQALRLMPFICSLLVLLLLYLLAHRFLDRKITLALVLGFYGINSMTLMQAYSVKQYVPDLAIALALALWALRQDYRRFSHTREIILWALLGSVLVWSSMPVVYVLASIGAYFAWQAYQGGAFLWWLPRFAFPVVFWLVNFGIYFATILHTDASEPYLQNYHAGYFLRHDFWTAEAWEQNWENLRDVVGFYVGGKLQAIIPFMLLYVVGFTLLIRKEKAGLLLLAGPFLLACLSSFLGYYSMIPRLIMFSMPIQVIVAMYAWEWLCCRKHWGGRVVAALLAGLFIISLSGWDPIIKGYKIVFESTRDALSYVALHKSPDEALMVNSPGGPTATFYVDYHQGKEHYQACRGFRWLHWEEEVPRAVEAFFSDGSQQSLWLLLGHNTGEVTNQEVEALRQIPSIRIVDDRQEWRARALKLERRER